MNTEYTVLGLNASDWTLLRVLRAALKSSAAAELSRHPDISSASYRLFQRAGGSLSPALAALGASEATDKLLCEKMKPELERRREDWEVGFVPIENIVVVLMQDEECS